MDDYRLIKQTRVHIEPVSADNFTAACKAAAADAHGSYGLTDVIYKGDEIIGHLSINGIPLVLPWFDTKKAHARDCMYAMNFYENLLKRAKLNHFILPCATGSPLQLYLERLGYKKIPTPSTLYVKEL